MITLTEAEEIAKHTLIVRSYENGETVDRKAFTKKFSEVDIIKALHTYKVAYDELLLKDLERTTG